MEYFGNAFSLQMLNLDAEHTVEIKQVPSNDIEALLDIVKHGKIESIIGHEDLAKVLNVPYNRKTIFLHEGDILYVAQVVGGRLPKNTTTLHEGIQIKYIQVTIK